MTMYKLSLNKLGTCI